MLLFHNNKIARIQENLNESIPNLSVLLMTNNNIANLTDIDALKCLEHLDILFFFLSHLFYFFVLHMLMLLDHSRHVHTLSLIGNPVTRKAYYREYVIHTLPHMRVLDFKKIRPVERREAERLFKSLAGKKIVQTTTTTTTTTTAEEDATAAATAPGKTIPPPPPMSLTQLKV